jgi:sec-independent protein translocase protein TatA
MEIGIGEIILILVVAVMIFGAGKIPEIGKQVGRGIRDFKKYSSGAEDGGTAKTPTGTAVSAAPPSERAESAIEAPELIAPKTISKN